jgi:hypothetical protein
VSIAVVAPRDLPSQTEDEIEGQIKQLQKQLDELKARQADLQKQLAQAKSRAVGGIKAEVCGILKWDGKDGGHYLLTRAEKGAETRVYLLYSEDKVTGRLIEGLMGKVITVTGPLHQVPENTKMFVPPRGLYLTNFEIKEVPNKDPK